MSKVNFLLIDEDVVFCRAFREFLQNHRQTCYTLNNVAQAGLWFKNNHPEVLILTLTSNYEEEIEWIKKLKRQFGKFSLMIFAHSPCHEKHIIKALRNGAEGWVDKNLEPEKLMPILQRVLALALLRK